LKRKGYKAQPLRRIYYGWPDKFFKQHCQDQRTLTSLSEAATKQEAIKEHKHILFSTRTQSEVLAYEVQLMHKKAKLLPESTIANKAYDSIKLASSFNNTQLASAVLFNCFNEIHRFQEIVSGDADGDPVKITKGENSGAITYPSPTTLATKSAIKKRLQKKAVKNLQEQNAPSITYEHAPEITTLIIEREVVKLASIIWLIKAIKQTNKSVKDMHRELKSNVSKNQAVLSKIRKAKASGNDQELLQIISGVLAFQLSGKVQDITIRGRK
jgi:hypothetical protein